MSKVIASPITPEVRSRAVREAVRARQLRGDWVARLRSGDATIEECLNASVDDEILGKMRCINLIRTQKGYGQYRAEALMAELDIAPSRRLGGLGCRQRQRLIEHFAQEAKSV